VFSKVFQQSRQRFFGRLAALLGGGQISSETWGSVEELLIAADLGVTTTTYIVKALRDQVERDGIINDNQLHHALTQVLLTCLPKPSVIRLEEANLLSILLVVGVNGTGKTTTIGKLASRFSRAHWQVIMAAADTFRAAAADQLQSWGLRVDVPVITGQPGADPGAVAYDAIRAARARNRNLLIVDTAVRLHTKFNLMEELKKVRTVLAKNVHEAPHETWLVVDGTTGQNALSQAKSFNEAVPLSGIIVTKLDSTAKGGVLLAIGHELGIPVRFIGIGEQVDDLVEFDAVSYVNSLISNGVE
jgi:fused signal recognition particle receptor